MLKTVFILTLGIIISGCGSKKTETTASSDSTQIEKKSSYKVIYITTYTAIGKKDMEAEYKKEVAPLSTDYFEIELTLMGDGKSHQAILITQPITDLDNYIGIHIAITDDKYNPVIFKNSTEFLNYMSAGGYDMVDQIKEQYNTHYTFKKK